MKKLLLEMWMSEWKIEMKRLACLAVEAIQLNRKFLFKLNEFCEMERDQHNTRDTGMKCLNQYASN